MFQKILGGLVLLMFAEIAMFIFIGTKIGLLPTLLLIAATSFVGMFIVKKVGFKSFQHIQQDIVVGNAPGAALIEGALFVIGAILLLVPGFISDILAVLLIVPATRKLFLAPIFNVLRKRMKQGTVAIRQKRS